MFNRRDILKSGALASLTMLKWDFDLNKKVNHEVKLVAGKRTWETFDKSLLNFDLDENFVEWQDTLFKYCQETELKLMKNRWNNANDKRAKELILEHAKRENLDEEMTNSLLDEFFQNQHNYQDESNFYRYVDNKQIAAILQTQKMYLTWKFAGFDIGINQISNITAKTLYLSDVFSSVKLEWNCNKKHQKWGLKMDSDITQTVETMISKIDITNKVFCYEQDFENYSDFVKHFPNHNRVMHRKLNAEQSSVFLQINCNADAVLETDVLIDVDENLNGVLRCSIK